MRTGVTNWARRTLYRLGALGVYHRVRNRARLTVVVFHRVLPPEDPRRAAAEPVWTLSKDVFRGCLQFFSRHYNVVGIDDLIEAIERRRPLPRRPLLLTFDDGWADNAEHARECLREAGLKATVFVVASAVGQQEFWQDAVLRDWRTVPEAELSRRLSSLGAGRCPRSDRGMREMLDAAQLQSLAGAGIAVGSHGFSHAPLSRVSDAGAELRASMQRLQDLAGTGGCFRRAVSFPHGDYNEAVVAEAFEAGYAAAFTSDPWLTELRAGVPQGRLFGRIPIYEREIAEHGRFRPERLASWLFLRRVGPQ
jgi:peptidoglycan/xylan/chitin deacetylase (PgdA/CDA1 family)